MKKFMQRLLKVGTLLLVMGLLAAPALADSYNAYPNTGQYVYDQTGVGNTKLASGAVLQVIYASGGTIHAPNPDGSPSGGDTLIDSTTRTVGNIGGDGYFYYALNGLTNGTTIYIRCWNASTISAATHYGDSATKAVNNPAPNPPAAWAINSFATTTLKPVADTTPPAAISDLVATTGSASGQVNLTWTAVGDDGTTGTASSYIVKYSTSAITSANFNAATTYSQSWTPAAAGATENRTLSGLTPGATLYFSIKARDEVPNTGAFGNCDDAVVQSGTTPILTSATPPDGDQGETLTSVAIVGSNTHFSSSSTVDFGAGITHGTITVTDATHLSVADVVIASDAAAGLRSVSVTTGTETATGDIFTVNGGFTLVVIDDYEGSHVADPTGYYSFGPSEDTKPTMATTTSDQYEGVKAILTSYPEATDGWRGWGATLNANKDISACDTITFWMKGDGSSNKVKIQFKDADGDNFALSDAAAISLINTGWVEYSVPISSINTRIGTDGNGALDLTNIAQYQFVFTGTSASSGTGIFIDYVAATVASTDESPVITSIDPSSAAAGTAVTIAGANFGTAGEVRFARSGVGTYSILSTDSVVTSYAASEIVFASPTLQSGTWNVTVYVDGRESNSVSFEVTASATGPEQAYNFPNPFNPRSGEQTTIVFDPGTSTSANIYIFDITAKIVQKLAWTGGAARVTWDGKNSYGETVGDGVYLYRVVDGSTALGKGKILVVNR